MSARKVEGSSAPAIRRDPYRVLSGTHLDQKDPKITYSNGSSMANLRRSIPSMVDGFKPAQRKILFCAFKKNLVEPTNVSDFIGYVSAQSDYYDGWHSLARTIVGMAQDYVGSNNINLLVPEGQFGTRLSRWKDVASAKYLYTRLSPITRVLFPKDDDVLLNYLNDEDGQTIEPTWYMPIIPTVLVNGCEAIGGTGCTTFIPKYNPREIVANIRRLLNGESVVPMDPWYRGFKGTIEKTASKEVGCTYTVTGLYEEVGDTCIRITELPIRKWINDYIYFVTSLPLLQDHKFRIHNMSSVEFDLILSEENMAVARKEGFLKTFKLTTTISTSNMHLFDKEGVLKKYATPQEILEEFFKLRLEYYELRKKIRLQNLKLELLKLDNKVRFIQEFLSGNFIVQGFREKGFTPLPKKATPVEAAVAGAIDDAAEESSMAPEPSSTAFVPGSEYDYLLEIPNKFLTYEKSQELLAEINKMNEAVAELEKTTPRSLWHRDLEALDKELDVREALDKELDKLDEAEKERKAKAEARKGRKQPAKKAETKKAIEPESSSPAMDKDNIVAEVVKPKGRQPAKKKAPATKVPPAKGGRKPAASKAAKPPAAASRKRGPQVVGIVVSPKKKVRLMRSSPPFNKKSGCLMMGRLAITTTTNNKEEESSESVVGNSSSELSDSESGSKSVL